MTLSDAQDAFHALATRASTAPVQPQAFLVGTPEFPASERIGVYADMYSWRLADALREDYPAVAAILGDERFFALAEDYQREHPSDDPDLGQFGRHLPGFLRRHPARERRDLADVAALELARTEVFFEERSIAASSSALASLPAAEFAGSRLELIPAFRLLALEHDVRPAWRAAQAGEPAGAPVAARTAVAVWRSGFDVFHLRLEDDEAHAIEAARSGATLARACASFADRPDPAGAAFSALVSWFDEGWIATILAPAAPPSGA